MRRFRICLLAICSLIPSSQLFGADAGIVVVGGTPGGVAAAIAAARTGQTVVLIEAHEHLGGMMTSGLGKSDIENRAMIRGLFREIIDRVYAHYVSTWGAGHENTRLCRDGYYYEPSMAEAVLDQMVNEQPTITVFRGWRLDGASVQNDQLQQIRIVSRTGEAQSITGKVFIDATYEGDLFAAAGAEYRLGREARSEFNEPHAGVIYFDYQKKEFLPGTTGAADDDLPAYTYRLCLTKDPDNSVPLTAPPSEYDRGRYVAYFEDLQAGRLAGPKVFKPGRGYNPAHFGTLVRALSVTELPNNKTDVNINPRPLGFPFPEENRGYVEGDHATRERISQRHRNLALGLLWFLQNDSEVPAEHRRLARELHLPKDEFQDTGHFPFQLYVREGRRLVGEYVMTEHDITGDGDQAALKVHHDCIAIGEFPIDSFPCRKQQPGDTVVLEGYLGMLDHITRPYQIPYRIMIPQRVDGLIVPVAASTTHVAFSSVRMEPTWMALGQAAGVAAALAIEQDKAPRDVPIPELQQRLRAQGQVLSHEDANAPHPALNPTSPRMLAGDWVPDDTHQIGFAELPRVQSEHVVINDVRDVDGVNQHNYLVHHGGQYWAMWSDGPGVEDRVGQRVKYATSQDGLRWSDPKFMTPVPPNSGRDSPFYNTRTTKGFRWISRGFWERDGELLALASLDEAAGFFGPGLELHAFQWNIGNDVWDDLGVIADNTINNFPPKKLANGQWMMSRRAWDYKKTGVQFLVGGVERLDKWESFPVLGSNSELKAEEPLWWSLPDGNLMALFRDNGRSGYLFRSFSTDNGRKWSVPVRTNFPDATSKLNGLRLKDGRYVLVSNANPKQRDPLVLSVSDDGMVFTRMGYLVGGRRVDYPHVIEHDGFLFIAFAGGKQTVEVLRIKLTDLDQIKNDSVLR
jgi:hypothetical protein